MKCGDNYFYWSDNWWIEENLAWFVDGEQNILFKVDLLTNQSEFIKRLPSNSDWRFRQNPRCMKYKEEIVCFPDLSKYIWIYYNNKLEKIEIKNPNKERLLINNFWIFEDKIFAISLGLKQIIEINIEQRKIEKYYNLSTQIAGSVKVNNKIYIVSAVLTQIYEFDLKTKECISYELKTIKDRFHTICFDGNKFWLSGYNKAIYVWDKENNSVKIINNFPESFGIYDYTGNNGNLLDCDTIVYDTPTFIDAKFLGKYIWFIPFKTNEILYVNRDTFEIGNLKVEKEYETKNSLRKNFMAHKYLVLYIKEERYIGVFSFKNSNVFEIDTLNLRTNDKKYFFNSQCLNEIFKNKIYRECKDFDRMIYQNMLSGDDLQVFNLRHPNIGLRIYENFLVDN